MYRKEMNIQSPLRILEKSIHGGLGKGNLGVVMARAGVGKTACLVQIGLDDLMRERPVLHVALEQTMEHVQSWYDALFDDLALRNDLDQLDELRAMITKNRVISAFADRDLWPERLEKTVAMFHDHVNFNPVSILVDGYPWGKHSVAENGAMIGAFKSYAKQLDAELWMTAQTHRDTTGDHPTAIPAPCDEYESLIEVVLYLEPTGKDVSLRLLKAHSERVAPNTHVQLHPDAMRLVSSDASLAAIPVLPRSTFTLLSGGAEGSEAEFGDCAEKWGLAELNFSYAGRDTVRTRGVVELDDEELEQGHVSRVYLQAHMHREYPNTDDFRKLLRTIWHQVNTAGEVFAIGTLRPDKTMRGGTGWAVELARRQHKPVFVYDQETNQWFTWADNDWNEIEPPMICSRRFTGTGTRSLNDNGRQAIRDLYERSFGNL